MKQEIFKYIKLFKKLRVDRSHGIAPHKPILLLSVLQAYNSKLFDSRKVLITPELVGLFKVNWNLLVVTNHECRISYPFYYMKSEKFWELVPRVGFDNVNKLGSIVKSFNTLNAAIEYAIIDQELYELAINSENNRLLQEFLLDEYFPQTKDNYNNSCGGQQKLFSDLEEKILKEPAVEYRQEIKKLVEQHNEEEIFIRGSLFKREIPKIYNNTCCISGMRIDATVNVSMIDACHIVPFSESYDDTVTNGIALCPNLHRAFDRGLIGIDESYRVIVSKSFKEDTTSYSIRAFDGKEIQLPKLKTYYPLKENFGWHMNNVLKR